MIVNERLRARFAAAHPFPLDDFQRQAIDALDAGHSVLVAAPTGAGKTLVAEYAIAAALESGTKTFYTTPLKALSNQKYGDFVRLYGDDNVGLLTGDNVINGDAPVVVMTTEVLRNMIYARSPALDRLRYAVLDEVHYLQDPSRGAVWEEVIIHLPPEIAIVALSATVSNAEEVAAWMQTVRGETEAVIEERRPVELATPVHGRGARRRPPPPAADLRRRRRAAAQPGRGAPRRARAEPRARAPPAAPLQAVAHRSRRPPRRRAHAARDRVRVLAQRVRPGRRAVPRRRDPPHRLPPSAASCAGSPTRTSRPLDDADLDALGYDAWLEGLEAGVAAHHAGLVPPMKEAVEEAFAAGLLQVVFATETLSLGINMPARSVVVEKLTKFTGEHHDLLTPGEYTQLAGRAGRRGIDDVGYAIVLWDPFVRFEQVAGLASRRTYALTSSFRATYNMAANLVQRYERDEARRLLDLSFAQFHADRDAVSLTRHLEETRARLARARGAARHRAGRRRGVPGAARPARRSPARRARRPGPQPRRAPPRRRGDGPAARRPRRGAEAGARPVGQPGARAHPAAHGGAADARRLPGPDPPRRDRRAAPPVRAPQSRASSGRPRRCSAACPTATRPPTTPTPRSSELQAEVHAHPLHGAPGTDAALRGAWQADRIAREVDRLERRIAGRTETLGRQFDRVLAVLESWGYVRDWELLPSGRLLSRLNTECDLVVAESVRTGLLDDVDPAALAAIVSCFVYQRRGPDGDEPMPPRRWPAPIVRKRVGEIERIWRDLHLTERDQRLRETRRPDPGFTAAIHAWAEGDDLGDILDDEEMTGGDFVRNVKQVIDLLRQLAEVAPESATAAAAHRAADRCRRGVVAASSTVTVPAAD